MDLGIGGRKALVCASTRGLGRACAEALARAGWKAELVGTGRTAWMQGARYGIVLDALVNDFVAGEIEHAVWTAWTEQRADVIVIEGQGSLMHPAYPGGFEILAAARPDSVVLQHAPARAEYDEQWLDYQHEIGLRHHRERKNRTDQAASTDLVPFRDLFLLIFPVTSTLRPFLAQKGHSDEDVEKMHAAWVKSCLLQVTLWSYPYVRSGDF